MPTDPKHLKWKTDNDLKTAKISTILGQFAFFSFLLVGLNNIYFNEVIHTIILLYGTGFDKKQMLINIISRMQLCL